MTAATGRPRPRKRRPSEARPERLYAQLARLSDAASRRKFVARHPELVRAETVTHLSEAVPRKVRVDVKEAMALADAAVLIARRLRRPESVAQSLRAKGNALYALNEHAAAVERHDEAVLAMPPRCRELIGMLFFETPARPYLEIARRLGLALGSIGFIRGRCLTRLRRELEKKGFR